MDLIQRQIDDAQDAKDHQVFTGQRRLFEVSILEHFLRHLLMRTFPLWQVLCEDPEMPPHMRRDIVFHSGTASTLRLASKIIKSVMTSQSGYADRTPVQHLHFTMPETRPKLTGVQVARTLYEVTQHLKLLAFKLASTVADSDSRRSSHHVKKRPTITRTGSCFRRRGRSERDLIPPCLL